jgi:predicted phage terminase large subunit-like protein
MEHENDKRDHQGAEYQFVGFDETTQFTESMYTFLVARLRRVVGSLIPLRARAASNPGGIGHEWVKQRFIVEGPAKGRVFVPARLDDNPSLDKADTLRGLNELDPLLRAQLLGGNWDVSAGGGNFNRTDFPIVDAVPEYFERTVRYWDLASTAPAPGKESKADWTVGVKMGRWENEFWLFDLVRFQGNPWQVEEKIKATAAADGYGCEIYVEQEPGASGVITVDHYQRTVLPGYAVSGRRNTGNKVVRAKACSGAAAAHRIKLLRGTWLSDFFSEIEGFPDGLHDDQVDALVGAYNELAGGGELRVAEPAVGAMFDYL